MELVRCEDEREDTTLEDRHLLFADLTFGKLSEDFEVREIDDDPDADASGEDSRLEPVRGLTSTVVVEESSLGEATAVPDSVRLVVKKEPQDEMRDQAVQERPDPGAVTNTAEYRVTNTAEYREYRKNILQHGTPEQITAFYRQEAKDKKAKKTEGIQAVTYSEEDKRNEYRRYILQNGTPAQIEAFYKIKEAKTSAKDKKAKKEEKLQAMRQRVHVRICIVPTCNNRTDNMDGLNFFLVPRDNVEFRANWEYALSTPTKPYVLPRHGVICQKHFQEDQLKVKQTGKLGLVKGTVPRLDLPKDKVGNTREKPFTAPPLFTAKEIKREMGNINPQANCTLEDPLVNLLPSSVTNPQSSEEFEAFGRAIVAKIEEHVQSPFYPSLLKDIMNGLKLGKVVSTKMYDRWLTCERKINELNDEIKEYKQRDNFKDIDKKKKYNALLAENCLLKAHKKRHDEQLERVEKKVVYKKDLANYIHDHLKPHLTLSQVKAYLRGDWKRATRINPEDYQRAKTLLDISPKAYEFLRRTKQLPLPSQSGLREYHSKHSMDLTTQDAVSSIQDAEVLVHSGGKLEQLAHLASSQDPHLSAVTKEPYRCVKCVGGVCDSTGGDCMPPPKKRKRAVGGGKAKKTGGSAVLSPKKKKAAAKAQHVVINTAPREIIMHQPQFVHTEVKPSVVYMTPRP